MARADKPIKTGLTFEAYLEFEHRVSGLAQRGIVAQYGLVMLKDAKLSLDVDALEATAVKNVGVSDFGAPYYRDGLTQFLTSIQEDANLNTYGKMVVSRLLLNGLENRLAFINARETSLELFADTLHPPLIVMGLPRTGTTHLHRLLATDSRHRAAPFWEVVSPLPSDPQDTPERREQKASEFLDLLGWSDPSVAHHVAADLPEECRYMLLQTFESSLLWDVASVYGYLEWYKAQDRREKYREYADLLKVLQQRQPEKRLVLKEPAHTDALDALLEAVPNALIVQTHRDPEDQCASWCSLNHKTRQIGTDALERAPGTKANLDLLETMIARNMQARERYPGRVYDVRYTDLVNEPIEVVKGIYGHYGLEYTSELSDSLERYVEENPQHKHGKHKYSLEDFGLSAKDIQRRFGDYAAEFV